MMLNWFSQLVSFKINLLTKKNLNKPWLHVVNTEPVFVSVFCEYMEDPTNMKLIQSFYFILPKKRPVLISVPTQNLYSWSLQIKKNLTRKPKLLSPQDSYKGN